jgi:lipopolysaccharide transport protein LptA
MYRTVKILRVVLPIVFVGFAILVIVLYSEQRRDPSPGEGVDAPTRAGDQPRLISYEFEDVQTLGDRVISRIRAERTVGFQSGWYTLDNVELEIYRASGGVYVLTAPSAEFSAESKEARAEGGVVVRSDDGLEIRTESILFDGRRLTNRIPVHFRMNQWSGVARGADLDVEEEILRLDEGVRVAFEGIPPQPGIDLQSELATFYRNRGAAVFEGDVVLERRGDTFRSARVEVETDQERNRLVSLEGEGNVVMSIRAKSDLAARDGSELEGDITVDSDRFLTRFDGDGEARAVEAIGEGRRVRAVLHAEPARMVESSTMRVLLEDGRASSLEAFGSAVMTEEGPSRRRATGERLVVHLDLETGKATSAIFDGGIRYADSINQATAERAVYDIREGTVRLAAVPGAAPTLSSEGQRVSADEIVIDHARGLLRGKGRVITRIIGGTGTGSRGDSAMFPSGDGPIFVNSDGIVIRHRDDYAAFSGNVRAWQGSNTLFADELEIGAAGESILARGNVRSILSNTGDDQAQPVKSRSGRLLAKRTERRVELAESVVIDSEGRRLSSDRAIFSFDTTQQLEKVEAIGNVALRENGTGRSGSGTKATYTIATETILLEGSPAEMKEARGGITGSQIIFDMKRDRVDVLQGDSPTEATYNPELGR